jgi:hypothetical protein
VVAYCICKYANEDIKIVRTDIEVEVMRFKALVMGFEAGVIWGKTSQPLEQKLVARRAYFPLFKDN